MTHRPWTAAISSPSNIDGQRLWPCSWSGPQCDAPRTSARPATSCFAFSCENTSGGRILRTLPRGPVALMRMRRSRKPFTTRAAELGRRARFRDPAGNKLHAHEEARAAHIGDDGERTGQGPDVRHHPRTHGARIGLKAFAFQDVEDRHSRGAGDGIAAEGVEVARLAAERLHDLRLDHHGGDGMTVAHRLAHGDDVRCEAVALETPQLVARAAEARLHFVGDEQASGFADRVDGLFQEAGRFGEHAVAREDGVDQKRRRPDAVPLHVRDRVTNTLREYGSDLVLRDQRAVRCRHRAHMLAQIDERPERRRQPGHRVRPAMIGEAGHDETGALGEALGHAHRKVVRLAAGAGEHDVRQRRRKLGQQAFGIVDHGLVEIARVRVQHSRLPRDGLHDMRMAVPHRHHIIIGIEIGVALRVVEPHAFAAHHMHRILIEQPIGRPQQLLAPRDQCELVRR